MKHIVTLALGLMLGSAGGFAQSTVKMRFSGNGAPSSAKLQTPDSSTAEENVAGTGTLGSFTFRNITAAANSPSPSSNCSGANQAHFARLAGGGLFRFEDGSLLKVSLIEGSDCIDFSTPEAHCILTLQITGGTGRFKNASGKLTYTEVATVVFYDGPENPVLTTEVGQITGTVEGCAHKDGHEEDEKD